MSLPNVYFGVVDSRDLDWRSMGADDPDDDDDSPASQDMIDMLGFDPDEGGDE